AHAARGLPGGAGRDRAPLRRRAAQRAGARARGQRGRGQGGARGDGAAGPIRGPHRPGGGDARGRGAPRRPAVRRCRRTRARAGDPRLPRRRGDQPRGGRRRAPRPRRVDPVGHCRGRAAAGPARPFGGDGHVSLTISNRDQVCFEGRACTEERRLRNVKGSLFADYVRMIRRQKQVEWTRVLAPEDRRYLSERIRQDRWYPMAAFERLGNGILREIAHGDLVLVRMWGRYQVDEQRQMYTSLIAEGDPVETLFRFRVLRATFFDFEALTVPLIHEDEAHMIIRYHMGKSAEEAA